MDIFKYFLKYWYILLQIQKGTNQEKEKSIFASPGLPKEEMNQRFLYLSSAISSLPLANPLLHLPHHLKVLRLNLS